ncbi:hypothetical protein ACOME3_009431 [Neoechinorhynchus agilis]
MTCWISPQSLITFLSETFRLRATQSFTAMESDVLDKEGNVAAASADLSKVNDKHENDQLAATRLSIEIAGLLASSEGVTRQTNGLLAAKTTWNIVHRYKYAWPFHKPVFDFGLDLPDYPSIVGKPMDLQTIREKLNGDYYTNQNEFISDVNIMLLNCMVYNKPSEDVHVMCRGLACCFREELMLSFESPDLRTHSLPTQSSTTVQKNRRKRTKESLAELFSLDSPPNEYGATNKQLKRRKVVEKNNRSALAESNPLPPQPLPSQRQSVKAASAVQPNAPPCATTVNETDLTVAAQSTAKPPPPPPPPPPPLLAAPIAPLSAKMTLCLQVVDDLLTDPVKYSFTQPFHAPLDRSILRIDDYFQIIKNPMDLSTIKSKIYSIEYGDDVELFKADLRLIVANCYDYNGRGSFYGRLGRKFEQAAEKLLSELSTNIIKLDNTTTQSEDVAVDSAATVPTIPSAPQPVAPIVPEAVLEETTQQTLPLPSPPPLPPPPQPPPPPPPPPQPPSVPSPSPPPLSSSAVAAVPTQPRLLAKEVVVTQETRDDEKCGAFDEVSAAIVKNIDTLDNIMTRLRTSVSHVVDIERAEVIIENLEFMIEIGESLLDDNAQVPPRTPLARKRRIRQTSSSRKSERIKCSEFEIASGRLEDIEAKRKKLSSDVLVCNAQAKDELSPSKSGAEPLMVTVSGYKQRPAEAPIREVIAAPLAEAKLVEIRDPVILEARNNGTFKSSITENVHRKEEMARKVKPPPIKQQTFFKSEGTVGTAKSFIAPPVDDSSTTSQSSKHKKDKSSKGEECVLPDKDVNEMTIEDMTNFKMNFAEEEYLSKCIQELSQDDLLPLLLLIPNIQSILEESDFEALEIPFDKMSQEVITQVREYVASKHEAYGTALRDAKLKRLRALQYTPPKPTVPSSTTNQPTSMVNNRQSQASYSSQPHLPSSSSLPQTESSQHYVQQRQQQRTQSVLPGNSHQGKRMKPQKRKNRSSPPHGSSENQRKSGQLQLLNHDSSKAVRRRRSPKKGDERKAGHPERKKVRLRPPMAVAAGDRLKTPTKDTGYSLTKQQPDGMALGRLSESPSPVAVKQEASLQRETHHESATEIRERLLRISATKESKQVENMTKGIPERRSGVINRDFPADRNRESRNDSSSMSSSNMRRQTTTMVVGGRVGGDVGGIRRGGGEYMVNRSRECTMSGSVVGKDGRLMASENQRKPAAAAAAAAATATATTAPITTNRHLPQSDAELEEMKVKAREERRRLIMNTPTNPLLLQKYAMRRKD